MQLNRKQLAFLIALFAMSIVVLALYNINMGQGAEEDQYFVEMVLEELEEEPEEEREKPRSADDPIKSHRAFNETARPSYGSPEPLKTLDELMEESREAEMGEPLAQGTDADYAARIRELVKKREEAQRKLGEKEAQKQVFTNNLAERRTSVSYSLVDRNSIALPPPIYTCIEGGKVVINILVDGSGRVTEAYFNQKSSGTSNGCLVDNAIAYALKARFTASPKTSQKGTITYLFQQKAY